ncbi:MAG: terminase [Tyzzerella sp.]|nr:terminase [Tyzzerella sp.]
MTELRKGRQTPTRSVALPYYNTKGQEAIESYNKSGRIAQEWQELLLSDILAVNEDGLWTHTKFGYSVPRRNGKNEIVAIRELYGLEHGEKILHTAHRTTTSSSASKRLASILNGAGYTEIARPKNGVQYEKAYTYSKQFGLERITLLDEGGGSCDFRTRSSKGGLGEGFDLLVIDEAQEYTDDQESALKYVVTDSKNPQTIFCGTPPTPVSSGTVFTKMRNDTLAGARLNTGWAEWSVEEMSNVRDKELWYETNPSLGTIFTERSITDEIGSDEVDFNIQRLGLWLKYNQKSAISKTEWAEMKVKELPQLTGPMYVGIKYGHEGSYVALSIAIKTKEGKIFVETVDCCEVKSGNLWILQFLMNPSIKKVIVDGANGQQLLADEMKECKMKAPVLPKVSEIIVANSSFEQGVFQTNIVHMGQPSVEQIVGNCEKRAIGTNGGFGYKAQKEGIEVAILDSIILAYWACSTSKEKKKQRVSY